MGIDNAIFEDPESFVQRSFSKWLWKCFGFLFGTILKHPELDIT